MLVQVLLIAATSKKLEELNCVLKSMGNCCGTVFAQVDHAQRSQNSYGKSKTSNKNGLSSPSSFKEKDIIDGVVTSPMCKYETLNSLNLIAFSFTELKNATKKFHGDNLLGKGTCGSVFKGWIDEQTHAAARPGFGVAVVIKKGFQEWFAEVNFLGQLHHPNLVKLIGYCIDGENMLLVEEFMQKGSLDNHLFMRGHQPLSWAQRVKVAIGAAKGLSFLHDAESQVIYRDFKASNILLDVDFNPKLSDFGIARAGPTSDKFNMGAYGYVAPEYVTAGWLSTKSDVYSFGVVLLELLSGRRVIDKSKVGVEQNLVSWATPYLGDQRKFSRIMDPKLEDQYPKEGAYMVATLALQCICANAKERPGMGEVFTVLEQIQTPN